MACRNEKGKIMFRVLIVDDEPMALFSTAHSFPWEKYGFSAPLTTTDPFAALDMLRREHFDAAIVDIRMPGMNGIDLIRSCGDERIDTVFIVLSGYSDFDYVQGALRLRSFDYCLKPVLPDDAEAALRRLADHLRALHAANDPSQIAALNSYAPLCSLFAGCGLAAPEGKMVLALVSSADPNALYAAAASLPHSLVFWPAADQMLICAPLPEETVCTALSALPQARCCYTPGIPLEGLIPVQQYKLLEDALAGVEIGDEPMLVRAGDVSPAFLELLEYVDQHFQEELSLQELANHFHLNYTYCSELFRSITGQTFTKYITQRRMKQAAELLVITNQSVNKIAMLIGYSNYTHFFTAFKNYFGQTPGAYREEKRKK